jgi:serine/threonine protein kinase
MAPQTTTELLDWLSKNLFLRPEQVEELRSAAMQFPDARHLCKELLQRDWLTPFQVNQILQGKPETLLVGSNRLLLRLGEGAMGQVYKAWNVRLSRVVAVKTIHRENVASSKAMERFRREMQTASRLDHPNIVLVRDADQAGNTPFLVMDFIEGTDLSRLVKKDGPLPVHVAADYIAQAALGLQHAFERGIIHRDIKPGNLLVSKAEGDKRAVVKILDFGLARFDSAEENRLTQFGNILGTVDYISPEQAQDARSADTRSDIYSLGCTFYYLLAGRPPFPGGSMVEKITARLSGPVPHIRALRPEVPVGVEQILMRMMARDPADRYQKPQEVAAALQSFSKPPPPSNAAIPVAAVASDHASPAAVAAPIANPAFPVAQIAPQADAEDTASTLVAALPASFASAVAETPLSSDEPFSFGSASAQARTAALVAAPSADPSASHDMKKWNWLVRLFPKSLHERLNDPRFFLIVLIACFCMIVVVAFLFLALLSLLFRSNPTPKGRSTGNVIPALHPKRGVVSVRDRRPRDAAECLALQSAPGAQKSLGPW